MTLLTEPTEFDCADCGLHVIAFGRNTVPEPPRCAGCQWLADTPFPTEAEREAMRAHMLAQRTIGGFDV